MVLTKKIKFKKSFNSIIKLIENKKQLLDLQSKSKNNFYLTDKYISNKIDEYRSLLINEGKKFLNTKSKKEIKDITYYKF